MPSNFDYDLVGRRRNGKNYRLKKWPLNNKLEKIEDIIQNATDIAEGGYIYFDGSSDYIKFSLYKGKEYICAIQPNLTLLPQGGKRIKKEPLYFDEKLDKWVQPQTQN
ncbi:Uncharacterised protein [Campylobacter hyointestinalis subsp. hyointestinalis]|uniref:Uncharacterized protein n=1 Tax=Campylobacter hyointestinalis subsp. hyointestinalis TaxID=91352 RepID=A0A0S4SYU2_CAMHY|nr:hypothetical protein [Campylobacter hyointestinalis]CUU90705.1 Uncharacterised protein [Campylobacter hyointestinalis subsp. hyointestinalis]